MKIKYAKGLKVLVLERNANADKMNVKAEEDAPGL